MSSSSCPRCTARHNIVACDSGDDTAKRWRAMASEYTTEYMKWPPQAKEAIRPPSNGELSYNASAKHDMKTMYEETYVDHPNPTRTQCIKPQQNQQRYKQGYFDCLSTYRDNFRNTHGLMQKSKAFRPCIEYGRLGMQSSEEKSSVSHQTYREYTTEEFSAAKREPLIIKPERGGVIPISEEAPPLQTTAQESFKCLSHVPRQRPIIPLSANGIDRQCGMELLTTHRADFYHKLPESCPPAAALIRERGFRGLIDLGPFDYRSTFQDDYIKHPFVRRPKSFKPPQKYIASEIPFQPQTLYSDDFKELPYQGLPKPHKLEGNLHLPESARFQGSTQYTDEFVKPSSTGQRRELLKPRTTRSNKGRFHDETSYNVNFLHYDLSKLNPRSNFKPVRKYEPPKIPFEVKSTAHSHYRGEPAPPSKICKPVTKPRIGDTKCICVS